MKIAIITVALCWASLFAVVLSHRVDRTVHPPTKSCTCGPTCPTPISKPWPIPASMEKLHGK